jgi:hypothetical protein
MSVLKKVWHIRFLKVCHTFPNTLSNMKREFYFTFVISPFTSFTT